MNLKDWAPLKLVDPDFLKSVRLCYVFGKTGHEALMVTDEDEVFACGSNFGGCLGLKNDGPQATPLLIPELSKKKVKRFSFCIYDNGVLVCAPTFSGHMYFWGKNFTHSEITPTPIRIFPIGEEILSASFKKFSEVECGADHCLALTANGEVYSWGYNDCGQLGHGTMNIAEIESYDHEYEEYVITEATVTNCDRPTLVKSNLGEKVVTKISCGAKFSVAVLDNGEVYAWGSNSHGQLGVDNQSVSNLKHPTRISELHGVIIRKITCGAAYVLAISDAYDLYSWGKNDLGQLGLGDTVSCLKPKKIESIGKVVNIATTSSGSTSAAMTERFKVYMWGECGELCLSEPKETLFESLQEVFAYFGNPRVMYKPMTRQFEFESVGESLKNAFNNEETSDLTIVAEDKKIFVHKVILKIRSNYFKTMLQEPWVKGDEKEININQKYDGIYAYLEYIYSGELKASPEAALELMRIADEYQDLVLKKICEKCIKHGISMENVAALYVWALKLNAKKLAKYCLTFACNHIGELIQTKGFYEWDKETLIEFIVECHKRKFKLFEG